MYCCFFNVLLLSGVVNKIDTCICFQGDKYSGHEPDALDLFKDCHYNKKTKGYTPAVQAAIVSQLLNDAISNDHFQSIANDHEPCLLLAC